MSRNWRAASAPDQRFALDCRDGGSTLTPLTPAVAQKIDALFPPETREAARRMITERCGADLPLSSHMARDPSGFDRIRFAVLKLSGGDLERLRQEIEGAHFDWRDTLMAAGFGEDMDIHAHLRWNLAKPLDH
jgi:hypothetical protein